MVKARTLWPGVESPPAPTGQGAEHPVYPCQSNCISSPDCHLLNDPSNKQNSYSGNGSESRNYDRDTSLDGSNRLTSAALSDTVTGPPKMTESGTQSDIGDGNGATGNKIANYKVSGSTVVNADNPIILFSPNIQNDFVVAVDATTPSNIKYKVTGQHRPYPSHEIYIDSTRVWEYNKGNNEPIDLFLPKIAVDTGYQSL